MLGKRCNSATKKLLFTAIFALIAGLTVFYYSPPQSDAKVQIQGTLLSKPREIKPFSLTGIDNKVFNTHSLRNQWTILFFGFTRCGSVCPTTMATLAKMYQSLEEKKVNPLPKVVMISIDPARDNLEKLRSYVKAFNPNFYAARGADDPVKNLAREMGIAYEVVLSSKKDAKNYDIQHSGALMLINSDGKLVAFFTAPYNVNSLVKDYQIIVAH